MNVRRVVVFVYDIAVAGLAWILAFWLRFNLDIPGYFEEVMLVRLPAVILIHAMIFWTLGLYRGLWRYASLPDLQRIVVAVGLAAAVVPAAFALLRVGTPVPRSVYLMTPLLLGAAMCASRLFYRAWKEGRLLTVLSAPQANPVLVIGAGKAAAALVNELAAGSQWRVVGIVDDDAGKQGGEIVGVKVRGTLERLPELARRFGVTQAVIAMPEASHGERKRAVELCTRAQLSVMTVPALSDIVSGRVSVSALRAIELDDLLGRDPVQLDMERLHHFLDGRAVLVTGAGGSIGSELCRQIARFKPARLVLYDISEFALYSISQEFADRHPEVPVAAAIGDAKNAARTAEVFHRYRPAVVFHAAAYKHVPLMEEENAFEAVRNNVLSTLAVARAAQANGAEKFVLVSTDKAVNPVNVMGASKRLAELVCQAMQEEQPAGRGLQFVIVRFGNVLGSTGSVVPRFREQIAHGGPVTVTHPEIERYFMSIPEASQLVLQAALMGRRGEIYVLDMGEPVKIADLARQMIRLSGLGESDVRIEYTGLRPGEKLYEEPIADGERTLATPHPRLRIARVRDAAVGFSVDEVQAWLASSPAPEAAAVRAKLQRWIPEYAPSRAGGPDMRDDVATPREALR